jgi:hypothetical protein
MNHKKATAVRHVRVPVTTQDLKRLVVAGDVGTKGSHQVQSVKLGRDKDGDLWIAAEVID